jgi:ATP-dependent Lhr-like helicase
VKARPGARLAATANGGAIPELGSYRVVLDGEQTVVGTLDEDFAIESQRGDVFLLGNNSWRILHVRGGDVVVADAHGAPPTIPFWRGEAPGRTLELSEEVSHLREELERRIVALDRTPPDAESLSLDEADLPDEPIDLEDFDRRLLPIARDLVRSTGCSLSAGAQVATYVAAQHAAIGLVPTQRRVVFERFFDETGGMQLVVHAPFGAGIARAWAFAMRKRFCRSFDFELQATADDDGFILSLGPQHSFPIESLFPMLRTDNARNLLEQSVLYVPMFKVRWRWNVTRALLVLRRDGAKKIPPALQRFRADDLLTAVFPKLTGCQEEHTGDHEIPDHPLTNQTMHDCLHEALDLDGLLRVLGAIERGEIELTARDTREPSPFSYELLNANPYAFLDGGEIQERRARAVTTRRSLTVEGVRDLGRLDPEAIARVRAEARPLVRSADELHDLLLGRLALPVDEAEDWRAWFDELVAAGRAGTIVRPDGIRAWVPTERWPAVAAAFPDVASDPPLVVPATVRRDWTAEEARLALARGLIETCGPITSSDLAARVGLGPSQAFAVLEALEGEGVVLRGSFTPHDDAVEDEADAAQTDESATPSNGNSHSAAAREPEWCHRRLLARIHRLTLEGLREEIRPVSPETFFRFLVRHHGLTAESRRSGPNGLFEVVGQLQGLDVPAACWERDLLPPRLERYAPGWLDELCLTGEVGWGRLHPPRRDADRAKGSASLTKAVPVSLFLREDLPWLREADPTTAADLPEGRAREVLELLLRRGALFASDLLDATRMLPTHLREALGELAARGLTTADGFSGLRHLLGERLDTEEERARRMRMGAARKRISPQGAGRWSAWLGSGAADPNDVVEPAARPDPAEVRAAERARVEAWAWQLLRRWGVVFRDLWAREAGAPSWFDLLQVYRRLEARGEIRGGRFVTGVAGEQFALGETVRRLRAVRDPSRAEDRSESRDVKREEPVLRPVEVVVLSAADPLNLTGVLGSAPRVPALGTNRVAYVNGTAVAARQSGTVLFFARLTQEAQRRLERMLVQPLVDLPPPTEADARRDAAAGPEAASSSANASEAPARDEVAARTERAARRTRRPVAPRSSTIPRPPVR